MKELLDFINASPTAFHCTENIKNALESEDYKELKESDSWKISKPGKYYVKRKLIVQKAVFSNQNPPFSQLFGRFVTFL